MGGMIGRLLHEFAVTIILAIAVLRPRFGDAHADAVQPRFIKARKARAPRQILPLERATASARRIAAMTARSLEHGSSVIFWHVLRCRCSLRSVCSCHQDRLHAQRGYRPDQRRRPNPPTAPRSTRWCKYQAQLQRYRECATPTSRARCPRWAAEAPLGHQYRHIMLFKLEAARRTELFPPTR